MPGGASSNRLAYAVVIVVTVVWVASVIAAMIMVVARNDPLLNSIFLQVSAVFSTVVGSFLALTYKRGGASGGGGGS